MNNYKCLLLFISFLFNTFGLLSQETKDAIALIKILEKFEKDFSSTFSYADASIEEIYLNAPQNIQTRDEALSFLRKNTPFYYTLLNNNIIAISPLQDAKNICGYIYDKNSEQAIASASINSNGQKVLSNEEGKFNIKLASKTSSITINYIGYTPLTIKLEKLNGTPCHKFYLTKKIENLDLVFLQNFITKGINKSRAGELQINYKDFGILPGLIEPDVLQTIQALPGIVSKNETVSYLNVRGGTHDQNLFLWDGIKMYQTSHFFGMISALNPYLTEEVSLIKNGSGATYGDGVSSVINMTTSQQVNDSLKVSAGLNMINADVYIDTPLRKNASLQLAARSSFNQLIETPTFNEYFKKVFQNSEVTNSIANATDRQEEFSFYDTSLRGLFQVTSKDFIRTNFLYTQNDLFLRQDEFMTSLIQSRISNLTQTNLAAGIFYERKWSDQFNTNLQFYGSNYKINATNLNAISNQKLTQENDVKEWGIKLETEFDFNKNFSTNAGFQLNETGITNSSQFSDPFSLNQQRETLMTNSVFGEINFVSNNYNTRFGLGSRLNHISGFNYILVEPRLTFNQRFLNLFLLEILAERKSQTTSQVIDFQTDFLGVENRRWVLSNPDAIPIIKSKQISIGLSYKHKGLLLNAEAYIKNVAGITTQSQGFQNQFEFSRTDGNFEVKGIDFLLHKDFKNFSGWLSYSISENNYFFETLDPQEFPNNIDITNVIAMGLSYNLKDFKVSSGFNWHSGVPTTNPLENQEIIDDIILFENPNSSRLPSYFRLDLSATYQFQLFKNVKASTGLSVWNLFNNKNIFNSYYRLNNEFELDNIEQIGLGVTPNFKFRINF